MRQDPLPRCSPSLDLKRQLSEVEPFLRGMAMNLCRDRQEADDLVQDTFERALRKADKLTSTRNLRGWLATIMHNLFIDRCRSSQRHPAPAPLADAAASEPELAAPPQWAAISAEQLWTAVVGLDVKFREVYRLHAIERLSYEAIAAKLGIRVATVGTRLHRARRKLREVLIEQTAASTEAGR